MAKKGLTLFEILVSMIIMSMLVIGIFGVFISAKRFAIHSRSRMAAAQMGKQFLDYLQMHVRADTWGNVAVNDLTVTGSLRYCDSDAGHTQQSECPPSAANRTVDNIVYNATYNVTSETFNLTRVNLLVTWNETTLY